VKQARGGLEVNDLAVLGGVKLGSEPWLIETKSWGSMGVETGLDSRWPGQVNVDLGPIEKAGSNGMATALIVANVWVWMWENSIKLATVVGMKGKEK
jgi:hypothetical protein